LEIKKTDEWNQSGEFAERLEKAFASTETKVIKEEKGLIQTTKVIKEEKGSSDEMTKIIKEENRSSDKTVLQEMEVVHTRQAAILASLQDLVQRTEKIKPTGYDWPDDAKFHTEEKEEKKEKLIKEQLKGIEIKKDEDTKVEVIFVLDETVSVLDNTKSILAPTRKEEEIKTLNTNELDLPSPNKSSVPTMEAKSDKKKVQWIPDADRPECNLCKATFGWFTRQHHCRTCGEIFCDTFSAYKDAVGDRLCKRCKSNPPNTYARPP